MSHCNRYCSIADDMAQESSINITSMFISGRSARCVTGSIVAKSMSCESIGQRREMVRAVGGDIAWLITLYFD